MKINATCPLVDGPIDTSAPSPTSEKPTLTRLRFVIVYPFIPIYHTCFKNFDEKTTDFFKFITC